jgi:uncharacterized protein YqjF (DUF2071 family)
MFQSWQDLLFAHWPISVAALRPHVPPELAIDVYDGVAWIGLTPFVVRDLHVHGLPPFPGVANFPELNLRTYVRVGERAGIYFFSLDAGSRLAVLGARALYRLPYRPASMRVERRDGWIEHTSRRARSGVAVTARYRPRGDHFLARPGSLEHFLVERYALYSVLPNGHVLEGDIHHRPWTLQHAEASLDASDVACAAGLTLPAEPRLLHFATEQDTLIWAPRRATWGPLVS